MADMLIYKPLDIFKSATLEKLAKPLNQQHTKKGICNGSKTCNMTLNFVHTKRNKNVY